MKKKEDKRLKIRDKKSDKCSKDNLLHFCEQSGEKLLLQSHMRLEMN